MTPEQIQNLKLGIAPIDDRVVLMVESAFEWINRNTQMYLDYDDNVVLEELPSNVKLFIVKFVDLMMISTGVTSESISGLSQSFDSSTKGDLLWQYASELLGEPVMSQMSFISAKERWW